MHSWNAGDVREEIANVHSMRDRLGAEAKLMLDPACVFDSLNDAIRVGRACADAAFRWYEDPIRPIGLGAFRHRKLREAIGIPVLQTEHVPGPEAKADFLLAGGTDLLRADCHYDLGITGCLKTLRFGESLGVSTEFRAPSPIHRHLAAAQQSETMYEVADVSPAMDDPSPPIYACGYSDNIAAISAAGTLPVLPTTRAGSPPGCCRPRNCAWRPPWPGRCWRRPGRKMGAPLPGRGLPAYTRPSPSRPETPLFQISHLRSFVAVGTELNFRRAAEKLNMTQPPLTRQIQLLEHVLGLQLFIRSGRSVRFTAAGERFFLEAQDILRRAEAAALSTRMVSEGRSGTVILGCIPVATVTHMPGVIGAIGRDLPGLTVTLREMLSTDQVEALAARTIDLGVLRYPPQDRALRLERVLDDRFRLAVHRAHPLAAKAQLSLADLHGAPCLMHSPSVGWYVHGILNGLFLGSNVRPRIVQYLDNTPTILAMVNAGIGLALVPGSARVMGFADVVWREIALPAEARIEAYLAWSDGALDTPAVARVHGYLLEAEALAAAGAG